MRITVHCKGLSKDDVTYLKTIRAGSARITVLTDGEEANINATGSFDDLVKIITQVTCLKNYEVHLH